MGVNMLVIILDVLLAFILVKQLQKLWIQIPLAILGGGFVCTFIGFWVKVSILGIQNVDIAGTLFPGLFMNSICTLIALFYFRRKIKKNIVVPEIASIEPVLTSIKLDKKRNKKELDLELASLGITFDGKKYHFQSYKYDNRDDAVRYAELVTRKGL
jgi:hypothetical protein